MRACNNSRTRVSHHERTAIRGERVLQLAWHHGCTANCVRWVTGTEFFICENECTAAASLKKQDTGLQTCIQVKALSTCRMKAWLESSPWGLKMCNPAYIHSAINHNFSINVYAKCVWHSVYATEPLYSHQTLRDSCFLISCSSPAAQQFSSSLQMPHLAHSLLQHRMC